MNCCWILLLLLCCGRGCGGSAVSCISNNNCCREPRNAGNACRRKEPERDCECEAVRPEPRMDDRKGCDVASMIPQPWQEYARRDAEDCRD